MDDTTAGSCVEPLEAEADFVLCKSIEGVEDVYHDGRLIDTYEYDYFKPRHMFTRTATMYVDKPFIPKEYRHGFYWRILELRVEQGEDHKVASILKEYMNFEKPMSYPYFVGIVSLLLKSYPIMQFKYSKEFDAFRRAAIVYHDQNVEKFRDVALSITKFLAPNSTSKVRPLKKVDWEEFLATENPIARLDILYTLRVWNMRAPFNCVCFSKRTIEEAENVLFAYDMVEFAKCAPTGPFRLEIHKYMEEKTKERRGIKGFFERFKNKLRLKTV